MAQHALELLGRDLQDRRVDQPAGVVDEDVGVAGFFRQPADEGGVVEVAGDGLCSAFLRHHFKLALAAARCNDRRALAGEGNGGGAADAGARPGDQRRATLQPHQRLYVSYCAGMIISRIS